ncbi:MAG TPA: MCE family protein [Crocinitomix sp.]|nr:MCE family protein [Crocinitomix sp.]
MKVSKEFKVGLLVVLGILLLYVGVNFLKGNAIFGKNREFYAVFDNANGLKTSNEVQINGVKVGMVNAVNLHPQTPEKILVKFVVLDDELLIPYGSYVELISADIMGTKALDLRLNTEPVSESKFYQIGDTLRTEVQIGIADQISEELLPLKKKTEELIGSVEGIIKSINSFWDTTAAYTIDESLYEFRDGIAKFGDLANSLTVLIEKETKVVDDVLQNTKSITANLASKSGEINNTIDNISAISDTLAATDIKSVVLETQKTLMELNEVLAKVNNGEGTIGALLHTDSLHIELMQTNQAIQDLLNDMEANPNKYVHFSIFGRKIKNN